ncbi:MAG: ankyrin repeat domain-containing protein [Gammaproteobacteria bacterium]|nr:ankyrin repeat domain-containing protein [Gammaproteobacteria bacterium]
MKRAEFNGVQQSHSSYGHQGVIQALSLSDDGKQLLTGSDEGLVQVFHSPSGNCQQTLSGHSAAITAVGFSVDNQYAISGARDNKIKIWDLQQGTCVQTLSGHKGGITCLHTLPNERLLVSGSDDKTLRIWDFPSGQCLQVLKGHQQAVSCCQPLSDWQYLLSGGEDKTIKLWSLSTARHITDIGKMGGHVARIAALNASYDDQVIASVSKDCTIRLWDMEHNKAYQTISAHATAVTDMGLSLNGRHAVSVARDGEIKLWQFPQGECLAILQPVQDEDHSRQHAVILSNDRQQVVATNQQGGVTFYPLDWEFRPVSISEVSHEARQAFYSAFIRRQTPHSVMRNVKSAAREISITGSSLGKARWQKADLQRFSHILLGGLQVRLNADQLGYNLKAWQAEQAGEQHIAGKVEETHTPEEDAPPPGFTHQVASGVPGYIRHFLSDAIRLTVVIVVLALVFVIGNQIRLQVNDYRAMKQLEQSVQSGGNINQLRLNGIGALHEVSRQGQKETIRYLLASGADINIVDSNGWSVLHYAVAANDDDMVEFLLEQGADPELRAGTSFVTPLWIAGRNENIEILTAMKETGN